MGSNAPCRGPTAPSGPLAQARATPCTCGASIPDTRRKPMWPEFYSSRSLSSLFVYPPTATFCPPYRGSVLHVNWRDIDSDEKNCRMQDRRALNELKTGCAASTRTVGRGAWRSECSRYLAGITTADQDQNKTVRTRIEALDQRSAGCLLLAGFEFGPLEWSVTRGKNSWNQ